MSALPNGSSYNPSPVTPKGVVKVTRYGWDVSQTQFSERSLVSKTLLKFDSYQRFDDLNRQTIHDIRKNFNAKRFGHLLVSRRPDGSLYIVDGLHRWNAVMERADITDVPCEIVESGDDAVAEEARLFVLRNSGLGRVKSHQKFKALVLARDEQAIAINETLERVGVTLVRSTEKSGGPFVKCVKSLLKLHERDPDNLERSLNACKTLMPTGTWPQWLLEGLAWLDSRIDGMSHALSDDIFMERLVDVGLGMLKETTDRFVLSQKQNRGGHANAKTWGQGIFLALEAGRRSRTRRFRLTAAAAVEAMQ